MPSMASIEHLIYEVMKQKYQYIKSHRNTKHYIPAGHFSISMLRRVTSMDGPWMGDGWGGGVMASVGGCKKRKKHLRTIIPVTRPHSKYSIRTHSFVSLCCGAGVRGLLRQSCFTHSSKENMLLNWLFSSFFCHCYSSQPTAFSYFVRSFPLLFGLFVHYFFPLKLMLSKHQSLILSRKDPFWYVTVA